MTLPIDVLASNDFIDAALPITTDEALYVYLQRSSAVQELTKAIRAYHSPPDPDIERFVTRLLYRFRPGRRFAFDATLAAIAVALQFYPSQFATKFIESLADTKVSEIPLAHRVARLVLEKRRASVIGETRRTTKLEVPVTGIDLITVIRPHQGIGNYRIKEQAA